MKSVVPDVRGILVGALALMLVALAAAAPLAPALYAASTSTSTTNVAAQLCYRDYVIASYAQYALLGFAIIVGLLAFGPVLLARTSLAGVLSEISPIAAVALVVLVFLLLAVFPLTALFTTSSSGSSISASSCEINVYNFINNGPPLAKLLSLIIPAPPPNANSSST